MVSGTWHRAERDQAEAVSRLGARRKREPTIRFVLCINNAGYRASLELHRIYRVVPDPGAALEGDVRVVDDSGEDYLYPAKWFAPVELPSRRRTSMRRTR